MSSADGGSDMPVTGGGLRERGMLGRCVINAQDHVKRRPCDYLRDIFMSSSSAADGNMIVTPSTTLNKMVA